MTVLSWCLYEEILTHPTSVQMDVELDATIKQADLPHEVIQLASTLRLAHVYLVLTRGEALQRQLLTIVKRHEYVEQSHE